MYIHKEKKSVRLILGYILIGLGVVFAIFAGIESQQMKSQQKKFQELAEPVSALEASEQQAEISKTYAVQEPTMLPQYENLWLQNSELCGWIKIEDTILDYPVMHTPNEPEKYLNHSFDGTESVAGSIFLDARCSANSDNLILYGHNMKNQTMFGSLLNYKDESYWKIHQKIRFDTLFEEKEYQIMAVFFDHVYHTDDTCFKYYNFIDAENEMAFEQAIQYYKQQALYDTGVSAQYGDKLLTLSTCSSHTENGRFVVVAKLVQ